MMANHKVRTTPGQVQPTVAGSQTPREFAADWWQAQTDPKTGFSTLDMVNNRDVSKLGLF